MLEKYIEVDGKPVRISDPKKWEEFMSDPDARRVASTQLKCGDWISTVFLGLDHNFAGSGPPMLYETMWFGRTPDDDDDLMVTTPIGREKGQTRTATREQALGAHWAMVWEAQKANGEAGNGQ